MFEIKEMIFRAVINRDPAQAQAPVAPAATNEKKKDDCCCEENEFVPLIEKLKGGGNHPKNH